MFDNLYNLFKNEFEPMLKNYCLKRNVNYQKSIRSSKTNNDANEL